MKTICQYFFILIIFTCIANKALAQGCSDAGFCTMGAMKPDQHYSEKVDFKLRSIEINTYRGTTTTSPVVYVTTADMTFSLTQSLFIQAKVPYQWVTGNLGDTQGVGDLSISITQGLGTAFGGSVSATLGTKIPTNESDLSDSNKWGVEEDLPMYYQTSLGSYDFIAGGAWINTKWLIATGVQIALTENSNDFKWSDWDGNYSPDSPGAFDYIRTYDRANNLKRGIDVMLRFERNFRFTNFNFNAGLLPIFRVTKDERYDESIQKRVKIDGTTGLALSALAGGGYHFNVNSSLKLILGVKLMERRKNPDGLTREFVSSLSYVFRF